MGITIQSVFKPLNDYFLNLYNSQTDVFFRFDKTGTSVTPEDFLNTTFENDETKRKKTSSLLVNHVLVEDPDKINVVYSMLGIDELYNKMMKDALPHVQNDDPNRDTIISNFATLKSQAQKNWETYSEAKENADVFRRSDLLPENWYDPSSSDAWQRHEFSVTEKTETTTPTSPGGMWRLKLNDAVLAQILSKDESKTVKPALLHRRIVERKMQNRFLIPAAIFEEAKPVAAKPIAGRFRLPRLPRGLGAGEARTPAVATPVRESKPNFTLHSELRTILKGMDLVQRFEANQFIKENAPVAPSETKEVNIKFEYAIVRIERPWMLDSFLFDKTWYMHMHQKGETTQQGKRGLSVLPIAFLAVRNLLIEAQWSKVDIENAKNATDFGPFEVSTEIQDNKLSHPGTQIIGWILERMPDLPPNDPPSPIPVNS